MILKKNFSKKKLNMKWDRYLIKKTFDYYCKKTQ